MELTSFFFKKKPSLISLSFILFLEFILVLVPNPSEKKPSYLLISEIIFQYKKFSKKFRLGNNIKAKYGQLNSNFFTFFFSKKNWKFSILKTIKKKKIRNLENSQIYLIFRRFLFSFIESFFSNKSRKLLYRIKLLGVLISKRFFSKKKFFFIRSFLARNSNSKSNFLFFYLTIENYRLKNFINRGVFYYFFLSVLNYKKNLKNFFDLLHSLKKNIFVNVFIGKLPEKKKKLIGLNESNFISLQQKKNFFFRKFPSHFKKKVLQRKSKNEFLCSDSEEKFHYHLLSFENKKIFFKKFTLVFNQFRKKIPRIKVNIRRKFLKKTLIFFTQNFESLNFLKKRTLDLCKEDNRFTFLLKKEFEKFLKTKIFLTKYLMNIIELTYLLINGRILSHLFLLKFLYKLLVQKKDIPNFLIKKIQKFLKKKSLYDSILHKLSFEKVSKFLTLNDFLQDQIFLFENFFSEFFSHRGRIRKNVKNEFFFTFLSRRKEYGV